jgi:hypothetical protein
MQENPLLEQLYWFFSSLRRTASYPSTLVTPQGKPTSNHTPCIITIQTSIPGSRIFWFEKFWVAHSGFLKAISDNWSKPIHKSNSAANIHAKFKRLRYDLKYWSKSISRLSICIVIIINPFLRLTILRTGGTCHVLNLTSERF